MKYVLTFIAMVGFLAGIVAISADLYQKRAVNNCMVEGGTKDACEAKFK